MSKLRSTGSLPALAISALVATVVALAACGDSDSTPTPTAACASYCATLTTNCTAANAQFTSEAACNTHCVLSRTSPEFWPAGVTGATSGNSLACRTYHGGAPAAGDPALHCPHAGPTGANTCGTWCETYCAMAASLCTGANQITFSAAGCAADCALYAADGANTATSGNTVQCRLNHLGFIAGGGPAATHCGHVRPTPTGACL